MTEALELTPAERRREKVKETILLAAERVFASEGETALSIRRLAEEIDYSPAAIYKYFSSKEDLIDELKEQFFTTLQKRIVQTLEESGDAPYEACFVKCLGVYIETAMERPHHYAAAFATVNLACCVDEETRDWHAFAQTRKGVAFMFLVERVKEGQALGVFDRGFDPYLAAKSVWASCHGLAHLMGHLPAMASTLPESSKMSREEFVRNHAQFIVRGLTLASAGTGGHL